MKYLRIRVVSNSIAVLGWLLFGAFLLKIVFINKPLNRIGNYYESRVEQFSQFEIQPQGIVLIGDSHIDRAEWAELLPGGHVYNRGINGDTVTGLSKRLSKSIRGNPSIIVVMIGFNDLAKGKSIIETIGNYEKLISTIKNYYSSSFLIVSKIFPVNCDIYSVSIGNDKILEFNENLDVLSARMGFLVLDVPQELYDTQNRLDISFTDDGVHLNGRGYLVWGRDMEKLFNSSQLRSE